MKRHLGITCAVVVLAFILSAQQPPPAADDELIVKARAFLDALSSGDFQAAARDFDETMMKVLEQEKMAEFWKQVPERLAQS